LKSKFLGGMIGTALGDAIGELAFRYGRESNLRAAIAHTGTLVYTDDTAMAIGLAESIIQAGRLDQQHLGDTFQANFRREPWRGYASGPPTLFAMVERLGISYAEAARNLFGGQGSFGNGAAMRIAPLGLFFHDAPDLDEQARLSASVTHAHPIGVDGAAVLACAIAQAVELEPGAPFPRSDFIRRLADCARSGEMRAKLAQVDKLLEEEEGISPRAAAVRLGQSVAAHESVPYAIYAFLRHPQSFEDCLFCAALNSADRDTVAAMACAIAGAYLGIQAIPQPWREKVEKREHIEGLAIGLLKLWQNRWIRV
jgi:poly(ADP-ribose) glycohydrolase ARH3